MTSLPVLVQQPEVRGQPAHLKEATGHMISKHGQAGPAVPVDVEGVGRHNDGLRPSVVCHQDADPTVTQTQGIVHHPGSGDRGQGSGVSGQGSSAEFLDSPGPSLLIQVDLARRASGYRSDANRHCVKGHLGMIHLDLGAERRNQGQRRGGVDLPQVAVHTQSCRSAHHQNTWSQPTDCVFTIPDTL